MCLGCKRSRFRVLLGLPAILGSATKIEQNVTRLCLWNVRPHMNLRPADKGNDRWFTPLQGDKFIPAEFFGQTGLPNFGPVPEILPDVVGCYRLGKQWQPAKCLAMAFGVFG